MISKSNRFFCIHGHFYQPPRENPVTDQIELQPSAQPYHDWNERIYEQCYAPNAASRILDDKGRINDIVNNYAFMSFNIGPTLFSWIEEKHPTTYNRILEGDRLSGERLEGHGNALAQVYNHSIMPLVNEKDKWLQIQWGIADFEYRFKRRPEGMWLAETAINMDTVCQLIRAGIKFTILAPTQALKIRSLHDERWDDVSNNTINPRRPYRIFPVADDGTPLEKGYLDVFFYDGFLSHSVGFEHLLRDADKMGEKISNAFVSEERGPQLVSICTDGESYGHHEPFGDMCASYLFSEAAPRLKLTAVNYAWYLAKHPPQYEVKLKNGYGEGTAWSCSHGVGRWSRDCGCSDGGQPGWNQKWRAPLHHGVCKLSSMAWELLERQGPEVFIDWNIAQISAPLSWQSRASGRREWWASHLKPGSDGLRANRILDALRFSQYISTSCAWFFADITGIEAMQNLKYALRLLQLLELLEAPPTIRKEFLGALSTIESNFGKKSGDKLLLELEENILPLEVYLGLEQWLDGIRIDGQLLSEGLKWVGISQSNEKLEGWTIWEYTFLHETGCVQLKILLAFERNGLDTEKFYYSMREDLHPHSIRPLFTNSQNELESQLLKSGFRILPVISFPLDFKEKLAFHLKQAYWQESTEEIRLQERKLSLKKHQFKRLGWPLPEDIQQMANIIENTRFTDALQFGFESGDFDEIFKAMMIASHLKEQGAVPHLGSAKKRLHDYILLMGKKLLEQPGKTELKFLFILMDLVDLLKLNAERFRIENLAFPLLQSLRSWVRSGTWNLKFEREVAILLLDRLNFNTDEAKGHLEMIKAGQIQTKET